MKKSKLRKQEKFNTTKASQKAKKLDFEFAWRTAYIGNFKSLKKANSTNEKISQLLKGRPSKLERDHDISELVKEYALKNGIRMDDNFDSEEILSKIEQESETEIEGGNIYQQYSLWVDPQTSRKELDKLQKQLAKIGLGPIYNGVALASYKDHFLSVNPNKNEVDPNTKIADSSTHFYIDQHFSSGPTPTQSQLIPLAANTGQLHLSSGSDIVRCSPTNTNFYFDEEYMGRERWTFRNPNNGTWVTAPNGSHNALRARWPWRHGWQTFTAYPIRKARIKALNLGGKYITANPGKLTAYYNWPGANMVFTLVYIPTVGSSEFVMLLAPDNTYVSTKYEYINNGPANRLITGWTKASWGESFQVVKSASGLKLKGPTGRYVYISASNSEVYGDGSSNQATLFQFEYV